VPFSAAGAGLGGRARVGRTDTGALGRDYDGGGEIAERWFARLFTLLAT
jgi:hypothetical protein